MTGDMPDSFPRYFIGLALPEDMNSQLFTLMRRLHQDVSESLKPLVQHITLLHPSSLDMRPDDIIPRINDIAADFLPFTLTLTGIDHFQSRVLYLAVDSPELELLQPRLVELLRPDKQEVYIQRGFTPHITLLQSKRGIQLDIPRLINEVSQHVSFPIQLTISDVACFVQTAPREYERRSP